MSRKRRFKKIIKGYLNRIALDGLVDDTVDTEGEKRAVLATIDGETDAQLFTRFGFVNPGVPGLETIDPDDPTGATTGTFRTDPAPFDVRDFQDVDGDGIGDNRDILLSKIKADTIFLRFQNGADLGANTGTLEAAAAKLIVVRDALDALVADAAVNVTGAQKRTALANAQALDADYTQAGIDALLAKVLSARTEYLAIQTSVNAMTATNNVEFPDLPAPYNQADVADLVAGDMTNNVAQIGAVGVGGRTNAANIARNAAAAQLIVIRDFA